MPQSSRLLLRRWRPSDREPFAALNRDPEVMENFPGTLSREESDALADKIEAHFAARGYGLWALELKDSGEFIGFTGLQSVSFQASFTPAVEIGWRLARAHWGRGYAREAARVALGFAFTVLGLAKIVSFTARSNVRSLRVMEAIGLRPGDSFRHPALPPDHALAEHELYFLNRADWAATGAEGILSMR